MPEETEVPVNELPKKQDEKENVEDDSVDDVDFEKKLEESLKDL